MPQVLATIRPAGSRLVLSAVASLVTTSSNWDSNTVTGERASLIRPKSTSCVYVAKAASTPQVY